MNLAITFDTGYVLRIQLNENSFVLRWADLLIKELQTKNILQIDTFAWSMTEDQARYHLISAIQRVNDFLKTEFIGIPATSDFDNPDYYNQLHVKFEELTGEDWDNPTRLMSIAPSDVKLAVRHINRFCHRLERRPYSIEPVMRVEFDSDTRLPLEPEDYMLFEPMNAPGCVYLDYSTFGKSLVECFMDGLEPDYSALKLQHHYCANFIINFDYRNDAQVEQFNQWLIAHGLNPSEIQGSGNIPLGRIVDKKSLYSVLDCSTIENITLE